MDRRRNPNVEAEAVYAFIVGYKRAHGGRSPSVREIGAGVGAPSTSLVHHRLRELADAGRIVLPAGRLKRHIALPGEQWTPPGGRA